MLLSELHARNAQMMMLPATPCPRVPFVRPDAFAATGYSPLCRMAMQGQHYAQTTGTAGHCVASSSGFGHMSLASSSLHGFASSSQEDHFDPDMFLVERPLQAPATGEVPARMVRPWPCFLVSGMLLTGSSLFRRLNSRTVELGSLSV
ncbi:hypothetical protein HU200_025014 [Digitaria exilis]|uniref:Uncharacterized protein n=1 Tax=Digitaria exilis TaxID=1010633 RepID=A0A835EXX6_9POAL|nr:hypothetical protein HU200_025014 [Digitaria exilis]